MGACLTLCGLILALVSMVGLVGESLGAGSTVGGALATMGDAAVSLPTEWVDDRGIVVPEAVAAFAAVGNPSAREDQFYASAACGAAFAVDVGNAYGSGSGRSGDADYPYRFVAEPFRRTTLNVTGGRDALVEPRWAPAVASGTGAPLWARGFAIDAAFSVAPAWETAYFVAESAAGGAACWAVLRVAARYVRREIRSYSDGDREQYLTAVGVMQRLPSEIGERLYGPNYRSRDHFNRLHAYYGGRAACDHWHQGSGFVTSHVALTLEYERSVQSIYPAATVPYWDISLESTFYDANTWRDSLIFSDDWFGAAAPANDLRTPDRGRFAFVPVLDNADRYSAVVSPYGLLRSPWNADPTPFMTRSDRIYGFANNIKPSGCAEFYRALRKDDWAGLSKQLNAAAHGHIHETLGGSWNHALDGPDTPDVLLFAHSVQQLSKELWRYGYLECPAGCAGDTPWADCACACDAALGEARGETPRDVLAAAGVLENLAYYDPAGAAADATNASDALYAFALAALCNPGHVGDMFQATSTNDPVFWLLHGNIDRIWHLKRLVSAARPGYDETWAPDHACYGHNPDDAQPWTLADLNLAPPSAEPAAGARDRARTAAASANAAEPFATNADLYDRLHPAANLPYIYDNFKWPHCDITGHNMLEAALAGLGDADADADAAEGDPPAPEDPPSDPDGHARGRGDGRRVGARGRPDDW